VTRVTRLAFLSPVVIDTIIAGEQPVCSKRDYCGRQGYQQAGLNSKNYSPT